MLKKFVTAMIIASMLTTGAYALAADQESVTAEAATAAEISAEQLLISVKEKITVPEELTEMSTSVSSGSGQTFYNFTWEAKDEYKGSLQVRCDSDGNIWNYYYYPENDEIKQSENFIPMEQLGEVAVQELKKLAPGCFKSERW